MYFDSLAALIQMEGHGVFVWPAYLITVLVVVAMLVAPGRRRERLLRRLAGELKREQGAAGGAKGDT